MNESHPILLPLLPRDCNISLQKKAQIVRFGWFTLKWEDWQQHLSLEQHVSQSWPHLSGLKLGSWILQSSLEGWDMIKGPIQVKGWIQEFPCLHFFWKCEILWNSQCYQSGESDRKLKATRSVATIRAILFAFIMLWTNAALWIFTLRHFRPRQLHEWAHVTRSMLRHSTATWVLLILCSLCCNINILW